MKQIHYIIRVETMKDTEHKISITSKDIDKIDEAIREVPYIYEPCPENPKLDDQFMIKDGIKTLVFCPNTMRCED